MLLSMTAGNPEPSPAPAALDRATVPEPPWRGTRSGRAPARVPLTRDAIIDAALRVLDRDGIDRLSMRRVADELGAGAASLYWHVRNKGELLQLLSERIAEQITLPAPDPARWQEQLRDVARQFRAAAHRHRDAARLTLGRVPFGPGLARYTEWLFQLMVPAGIPDRVIAYLGDLASLYVGAYAFEESLGLASPTGEPLPPDRIVAMFRGYLLSLPVDTFPNVHRAIDHLFGGDADERFEFGLDLILRGVASFAHDGDPGQSPDDGTRGDNS
jgi:TetR/AcrR family transcriptional regulator, tetracycline repressor protein